MQKGTGEKLSVSTVPAIKKGYVKCHALRALKEAVGNQSFFGEDYKRKNNCDRKACDMCGRELED